MKNKILIYIQHNNGKIAPVSLELIGEAQRLSKDKEFDIYGVFTGTVNSNFVEQMNRYPLKKAFSISTNNCYTNIESIANGIVNVIQKIDPQIVLIGATKEGRAVAPCVAVQMKTGLTADCIELQLLDDGKLLQIRPAFDDKVLAHIVTRTDPQMATVRPGIMAPPEEGKYNVEIEIMKDREHFVNHNCEVCKSIPDCSTGDIDIKKERKLVVLGAGVKNLEDVAIFEKWAKSIGAEIACSRKLVERGWFTVERQVGLSGNSVHADCMITIGVSGSIQFQAGIKNVKKIISVNHDVEAPILKIADYPVQMEIDTLLKAIQ